MDLKKIKKLLLGKDRKNNEKSTGLTMHLRPSFKNKQRISRKNLNRSSNKIKLI